MTPTPALRAARTVLAGLMHHRKTPQAGPIVEALDAVKTVVVSLSLCLKTGAAQTLANCGDPEISALAKESFEIARDYANTALLLWPATAPAARRAPQQRTAFKGTIMENIKPLNLITREKFDAFNTADKNEFFRTGGKISQ